MKDIITIGDATEDVFLQLTQAKVSSKKNKQELSMEFGTKIPVGGVSKLIGGNAMNVAIGCSRLGLRSALYAELGKDAQGNNIKQHLKKDKVSTAYVFQRNAETNYSVVLNVGAERTILVYHVPRQYKLPQLEQATWCYYSSISHTFYNQHAKLVRWLDKHKVRLAFNPGSFHLKKGTRLLSALLQRVHVLFLNKEEAQLFAGTKSTQIRSLARKLKALGPELVVITDGPQGSYAYDGHELFFQNIYPVPVIERTGCGDAYGTGFTAALMKGHTWQQAMRWGTLNAASVLQQIGPQQGLATERWIQRQLKSSKLPKLKKMK